MTAQITRPVKGNLGPNYLIGNLKVRGLPSPLLLLRPPQTRTRALSAFTPKMHPCLSVHDILILIVQYATMLDLPFTTTEPIRPGDEGWDPSLYSDVRALTNPVALALTCRTFLEPGLDIVWYEIPTIDSFKNCLPPRNTPVRFLERASQTTKL
ncbi:hypothetical protein B0H19DRAFT_581805 [Mycena capillaripes]|nr:hypothetical protein B0H19DRAFT_581805 [Mycena capillaripes]